MSQPIIHPEVAKRFKRTAFVIVIGLLFALGSLLFNNPVVAVVLVTLTMIGAMVTNTIRPKTESDDS